MTLPRPDSRPLAIYLNDHLAGAVVARELARRALGAHRDEELGDVLAALAAEIDADRRALLDVMARARVAPDPLKQGAGWAAEKLGRLKLNGSLLRRAPLSTVIELEGLALAVHGKLALWRGLAEALRGDPRMEGVDFAGLARSAERQLGTLEAARLRALAGVLGR